MRFTPSFLDEIKARLPVSEVVRRRVKLTKAGREFKGLSPFTSEKSPSFFVNDQKMAWFDFSSGRNGNVFDFVMETEGLTFPEAVERLAAEAGLSLPTETPETRAREQRRAGLTEVLELAADFFEAELQGRAGARARGYLADRGLGAATQKQFRIGYSPNEKYALRDHLAGKGASLETMIEAGLLVHGEEIAVPYDRFRDRVMFPICDRSGHVIAFGGRALDKEVSAKYLNSPETPLFHKGAVLYNHHNARKAAHDRGTVIAVEGYVDVISMSVAGFPNVVAPLGTALTADQCDLLWRMGEEPILCFDGDRAGRKAANRAIDTALPLIGPGKSLRFAFLPEGQDPDDLARSGGQAAIAEVLASARPLVDVLWTREAEAGPLDTPERRAALERRLSDLVKEIKDETLRKYYRDEIMARLDAMQGRQPGGAGGRGRGGGKWTGRPGGQGGGGKFARGGFLQPAAGYLFSPPQISPSLAHSQVFARSGGIPRREAEILVNVLHHPVLLARHVEDLAEIEFASREAERLKAAMTALAAESFADFVELRLAVDACGLQGVREAIEIAAQPYPWSIKPDSSDLDAERVLQQALALHRRARALHRELKSAERALGEEANEQNLARLREIQAELTGIEGREAAVEGFGLSSGRKGQVM
ncbi:MAG: DNA primase [Beijerinckiaceae bacterium]|jgi:DNA primase|nr:DNA primase [Beijerinckiaceae bacterium]